MWLFEDVLLDYLTLTKWSVLLPIHALFSDVLL